MGLAARISTAIRAVMAALGKGLGTTMRWCGKTGKWVADKTTDAIIWTAQSTAEMVVDTVDVVGRTVARGGDLVGKTAAIPSKLLGGMLGGVGGGAAAMPVPAKDGAADRRAQDVTAALEALRANRQPLAQPAAEYFRPRNIFGEIVHAYANSAPQDRLDIDLDMLPPYLRTWLLSQDETALQKLAEAGPQRCGQIASGKRRVAGIGVPDLDTDALIASSSAAPYLANTRPSDLANLDTDAILAASSYEQVVAGRIARAKGAQRDVYAPMPH